MEIPHWDRNKVIPPIRPGTSEDEESQPFPRSPYRVTLVHFVERFAVTGERVPLIEGLLNYREALHQTGTKEGFQWIDGSFVEHVEERAYDPHIPNDIDVVTFFKLPDPADPDLEQLFRPPTTKQRFHVDAYGVQLGLPMDETTVSLIAYWTEMWSHRRRDRLWKGYVEVNLDPAEDGPARQALEHETRRRRLQ